MGYFLIFVIAQHRRAQTLAQGVFGPMSENTSSTPVLSQKRAPTLIKDKNSQFLNQEVNKIIEEMRAFARAREIRNIINRPSVLKPVVVRENNKPAIAMIKNKRIQGSFVVHLKNNGKSPIAGIGSGLLIGATRLNQALDKIRGYCINFDNLRGKINAHICWRDFSERVDEIAIFNSLIKGLETKADECPLTDLAEQLLAVVYQWARVKKCIEESY